MNEATMTDADMKQREKIVKSMKKSFKDFRKRYGADAKNVMYATATKMAMKEAVKDEADKGEYDYEGDMAKSSLRTIARNAQMMHDMLDENTNLPEWVASKITLAEDYIVSAAQYMQSEMSEEVKLEEGSYNPEPARQSSNKRMVKKGKAGRERNAQQYMKNMMLPRSQRKSAPIKGTDKHGNRFAKHVSGPYMGEEVDQVDEYNATPFRNAERGPRGSKPAGQPRTSNSRQFFRPPEGFTKKGIEKGGGVKTVYHYKGKSNTPSGATMKMGGVTVPLGKTPTKRRVKEEMGLEENQYSLPAGSTMKGNAPVKPKSYLEKRFGHLKPGESASLKGDPKKVMNKTNEEQEQQVETPNGSNN